MLWKLMLLFSLGPVLEILLLLEVGKRIGTFPTILLIILTGTAGAFLARTQGLFILSRVRRELAQGNLPGDEILNGFSILLGGVMLIAPGLITDSLGLALILPATRTFIREYVKRKLKFMLEEGKFFIRWKE